MKKLVMVLPVGLLAVALVGAGVQLGARRAEKAGLAETTPDDGERGAELDRTAWENRGLRARIEQLEARLASASCDNGAPAGPVEAPAQPAPVAAEAPAGQPPAAPETVVAADVVAASWTADAEARLIEVWGRLQAEGATRGPGQVSCSQDQCRVQVEPGGEMPVAARVQRILLEVSVFLPNSVVEANDEGPTTIVFRRRPG